MKTKIKGYMVQSDFKTLLNDIRVKIHLYDSLRDLKRDFGYCYPEKIQKITVTFEYDKKKWKYRLL